MLCLGQYLSLDTDHNGMLNKSELSRQAKVITSKMDSCNNGSIQGHVFCVKLLQREKKIFFLSNLDTIEISQNKFIMFKYFS